MSEDPTQEPESGESGQIATSTLAEIYAQQGLLGRALAIYRRMLSRAPEDGEIARRIATLERRIDETADEDERTALETAGATTDGPEAPETLDSTDIGEPSESKTVRERLPWDPPESEPGRAGGETSPPAVRPMDRNAFGVWLENR